MKSVRLKKSRDPSSSLHRRNKSTVVANHDYKYDEENKLDTLELKTTLNEDKDEVRA